LERAAVFVDAGYVFAQGSVLLTCTRQNREFLSLDIRNISIALRDAVATQCGLALLRIYWYDAMRVGRPTPEQMALANFADIKIRLGQVNSAGEQKGVDALIVTDLAELARNQAMADAVLVSGDEDVRVGLVLAQQFGVRVHLVGIHPARANQSRSLLQEADTAIEWDQAVVRTFRAYSPPVTPPAGAVPTGAVMAVAGGLDGRVEPLVASLTASDLAALKTQLAATTQVPAEHDRTLLRIGRAHYLQAALTATERSMLRSTFVRLVLARR
jgi:uncharacterized LabA/DUF88 family protein